MLLPANTNNRLRPWTRRSSQPSGRRATHRHAQGERGLVLQELAAAGSLHAASSSLFLAHPCCTCLPVRVHPCRQDLSDATAQMSELFKRVKDIQQKAADSEVLVQEICRDIRKVRRSNPASCAISQVLVPGSAAGWSRAATGAEGGKLSGWSARLRPASTCTRCAAVARMHVCTQPEHVS